jgi:hypothetical protein
VLKGVLSIGLGKPKTLRPRANFCAGSWRLGDALDWQPTLSHHWDQQYSKTICVLISTPAEEISVARAG